MSDEEIADYFTSFYEWLTSDRTPDAAAKTFLVTAVAIAKAKGLMRWEVVGAVDRIFDRK